MPNDYLKMIKAMKESDGFCPKELFRFVNWDGFEFSERDEWLKAILNESKVRQEGKTSRFFDKVKLRPYRSYARERERQLMRQVATQLYFYLDQHKYEGGKLVEVEVMHIEYGDKDSLFIAVNEHGMSWFLPSVVRTNNTFRQVLCRDSGLSKKNKEGRLRQNRFKNKLNFRVFSENIMLPKSKDNTDGKRAHKVAELLRSSGPKKICVEKKSANNRHTIKRAITLGGIYFVEVTSAVSANRHAEEFLTDIADIGRNYAKKYDKHFYASVAGKKRPCVGCSGRMKGSINQYGKHPGLFWKHSIRNQSGTSAKNTLHVLCTQSSNKSLAKNNRDIFTDYDSGSDSEDEVSQINAIMLTEPWASLIDDDLLTAHELMKATSDELSDMVTLCDIETLMNEDADLEKYLTLYRENSLHLECLDALIKENLEDLLLESAPNVDPLLMEYAVDNDADIEWVRAQLPPTEKMLFDVVLDNYFYKSEDGSSDLGMDSLADDLSQLSINSGASLGIK